jgi:AbrB family looped-hinge helix DNA binding protein
MPTILNMDKAGRLILPKPVRDQLHLAPGDALELEIEGDRVLLSPVRTPAGLHKEMGIWVYRSGKPADQSVVDLIEAERDERFRETLGRGSNQR